MLENNFTLSKTEFIAYLKCPFQYYLMKELNESTDYNDYEPYLKRGIKNHKWFQNFYRFYGKEIMKNKKPVLRKNDRKEQWKKLFFEFELNRYKTNPEFWKPITVEYYLEVGRYKGKIDRIDKLDQDGNCRIIEYKSVPNEFDEQEMLFYSLLLTKSFPRTHFPDITKVKEIGIFYYSLNEFWKSTLTSKILNTFDEYLTKICIDIMNPENIKKRKNCNSDQANCLYREICHRIILKRQKIIGL